MRAGRPAIPGGVRALTPVIQSSRLIFDSRIDLRCWLLRLVGMARTGLDGHRSTTSSPRWSYGMAHENPRWEYKRIEAELLKFGFCRSSAEPERRLATFVATSR